MKLIKKHKLAYLPQPIAQEQLAQLDSLLNSYDERSRINGIKHSKYYLKLLRQGVSYESGPLHPIDDHGCLRIVRNGRRDAGSERTSGLAFHRIR